MPKLAGFAALLLLLLALSAPPSQAAPSDPCLQHDQTCTEKLQMPGSGGGYVTIYRNYPLDSPNPSPNTSIDRALIMVHGAQRNGDGYFATALAAAAAAGKLLNTVVIAPIFKGREGRGCNDPVEPGELFWSCQGWNAGFPAAGGSPDAKSADSFAAMDRILLALNDQNRFPNLKTIVVAGHSGGGQFMQRYAAMNQVEPQIKVPVRYVVGNPSSYLYLDDKRPSVNMGCTADGKCTGSFGAYSDRANCTGYNTYRYGMESLSGYAAKVGAETIKKQFPLRNVTYVLGDLDVLPDTDLDKSCPAMAQGVNRRERGLNFFNFIRTEYRADHKLVIVPRCGHNAACMFNAAAGVNALFPK